VSAFSQLTYTAVLLAVLGEQLCLPIPALIFLMAAGALSARGEMHTSIIIPLCILTCLTADGMWFWLGRRWGSQAMRLVCRLTADPRQCSRNAREKFSHYGLALVCVARFFPGLGVVMPSLAAAEGASFPRFLACDTVGGFVWSSAYVGLGYLFSDELDFAARWARHFGTALVAAIGVPISVYIAWRGLILVRMIRRLRLRRISPPMLQRKIKSNGKLAVLDLLNFEEETKIESPEAIPGAFRINPAGLRKSPHINVPDDVEIVLYSSSGGDMLSARVAVALKRIGVEKVWVLEGGLKAWREYGFAVAQPVADGRRVARERLGIELPKPQLTQHNDL